MNSTWQFFKKQQEKNQTRASNWLFLNDRKIQEVNSIFRKNNTLMYLEYFNLVRTYFLLHYLVLFGIQAFTSVSVLMDKEICVRNRIHVFKLNSF